MLSATIIFSRLQFYGRKQCYCDMGAHLIWQTSKTRIMGFFYAHLYLYFLKVYLHIPDHKMEYRCTICKPLVELVPQKISNNSPKAKKTVTARWMSIFILRIRNWWAPIAAVWMCLEFRIRNQPQYQPAFVTLAPPLSWPPPFCGELAAGRPHPWKRSSRELRLTMADTLRPRRGSPQWTPPQPGKNTVTDQEKKPQHCLSFSISCFTHLPILDY